MPSRVSHPITRWRPSIADATQAGISAIDSVLDSALWAAELDAEERARARKGLSERAYDKGGHICHRGYALDYWTGIVTGLVKMSSIAYSGKPITFAGIGPGGWFGEGSILKNEPRKYDVVALRPTQVALLNRATFMWLYENSVGFNRFLVRQLNERLGQFIAITEQDRMLEPEARVGRHLAWLFHPILSPRTGPTIEITQEELALLAGVSRPVAARALQSLAEEGLITIEHASVTIHDFEALSRHL